MQADMKSFPFFKAGFFILLVCGICSDLACAAPDRTAGGQRYADGSTSSPQAGRIIVKFGRETAGAVERGIKGGTKLGEVRLSNTLDVLNSRYRANAAWKLHKAGKKKKMKVEGLEGSYLVWVYPREGETLEDVARAYGQAAGVEYAEVDQLVRVDLEPNDGLYPLQWALDNQGQMYPESGNYNHPPGTVDSDIDAPEAWDIWAGGPEIVVAVVDTGVDYQHRDLMSNIWINEAEAGGEAGIDDDDNGYVDDVRGWDFTTYEDEGPDNDPMDQSGHGTHVSGIIAAEGDNGLDTAGVCHHGRVMAVKFLNKDGEGWLSDAVRAIYYAVENGADVISNSWGAEGHSEALREAIDYAHSRGAIIVASAGNEDSNTVVYPAGYEHVISVAATDSMDQRATFSNYGQWVDIAAPGVDILSLRSQFAVIGTMYDSYTTILSGTSMSCPHVSGACALIWSMYGGISSDEVESILMGTADAIEPGICVSGRLNIFSALRSAVVSRGRVDLDKDVYGCGDIIKIWLGDIDLAGEGTREVEVTTSGGDFEAVLTSETKAGIGVFRGEIPSVLGDAVTGDGILQVNDGDTIAVTYIDEDDGSGGSAVVSDVAEIDCMGPVVYNLRIDAFGPQPKVLFETDEASKAEVLYGQACPHGAGGEPCETRVVESILGTSHIAKLTGVQPETEYFFVIKVRDAIGNETVDSNGGDCYSFRTDGPGEIYVPEQYDTIQMGIDHSWDGGTVRVSAGRYRGEGNRDIEFRGKSITVRSEDGPENCIIDCNGSWDEPHQGFYFNGGEGPNSVLYAFTITGGYAGYGGGIYCEGSSPSIVKCNIGGNSAAFGGGIGFKESGVLLVGCEIRDNETILDGGGIYSSQASVPTLTNCSVTDNSARYGGGLYSRDGSDITLSGCNVEDNRAEYGGGIYNRQSSLEADKCEFRGNAAERDSGGIHNDSGSDVSINRSVFSGNSAGRYGGGINNAFGSRLTAANCVLSGNRAGGEGGGICNSYGGRLDLKNCTIVGNRTGRSGGGIYNIYQSRASVRSCILRDNMDSAGTGESSQVHGAGFEVDYSSIQGWSGGLGGQGNTDADPCFFDSGYRDANNVWVEGDYHLLPFSACIDGGDPNYEAQEDETDLEGNARIVDGDRDGNSVVDMGAYESHYIEAVVRFKPEVLNRASKGRWVKIEFILPAGITAEEVDVSRLILAGGFGIESDYLRVTGGKSLRVEAGFDRQAFVEEVMRTGNTQVTMIGWLSGGRNFYGTAAIK